MAGAELSRDIRGYQQIRLLAGQWQAVNKTTTVEFRESACGSIIIETWHWPEKQIEALTVYFLDSQQLTATHYCPLGNQPTLQLIPSKAPNRFNFQKISISNLKDKNSDHCESFWFEFGHDNQFIRSESYWDNGILDTQQSIYQRIQTKGN
ncbi:hypothetical protein [Marinicella litoralis]|uniref:SMODS-associating 2TM beta-strand rich effector domain-containing protein n=1 Tax=Marinicella litoralis TaxID=644220 RepID=A0A4R6Y055_9GAMM|nr:hypothetical protein [Marinicella litoralis]TDR23483.1 hypothetical protein C8D91_0345 [Marinicella litoralis]